MKYLKILWRIFRMSTMQSLIYRADVVTGWIVNTIWLTGSVALIYFYFSIGGLTQIAGFTAADFYFVLLCAEIMWASAWAFVWTNSELFYRQIHNGELDSILIKPINPEFGLMFQCIWVDDLLKMIVYSIGSVVLTIWFEIAVSWWQLGLIALIVMMSCVLMCIFIWISSLLCFFWERFDVLWRFLMNMGDASRMPRQIFPNWLQLVMFYVVPILVMINPVYAVLDNTFGWAQLGQLLLVMTLFSLIFLILWRAGLRKYNSAA